jgi:hypothetical protein
VGDAKLSDFGYDAQLRRSLSLGDLLVYGLVFISLRSPSSVACAEARGLEGG